MSTAPSPDSVEDLARHRGAMLRFARRRIRDEALAEDAVQDALLAALAARERFNGRSALRTWLIGILNHKIQDVFRRETRFVKLDASVDDPAQSGDGFEFSTAARSSSDADDPVRAVARRRMHEALATEVERLPSGQRSVFIMQVIEGVATSDVSRRLNISEANVWVRLHRARKRLSERLEAHLEPA